VHQRETILQVKQTSAESTKRARRTMPKVIT